MDQAAATTHSIEPTTRPRVACSRYRSSSHILHDITGFHGENISVRDLYAQLGDRGFGIMLLLFALPNSIPLPLPGISTITGLPLIFFAAQLCAGRERVWLPAWVSDRQIPMTTLKLFIRKTLPWLVKLEKIVKPRLDFITTRRFERIVGGVILLLALLIALPVPFGNFPLGIAMTILALAITERDGILMIIGWLTAILALCFFAALVDGYGWIIGQLISAFFS